MTSTYIKFLHSRSHENRELKQWQLQTCWKQLPRPWNSPLLTRGPGLLSTIWRSTRLTIARGDEQLGDFFFVSFFCSLASLAYTRLSSSSSSPPGSLCNTLNYCNMCASPHLDFLIRSRQPKTLHSYSTHTGYYSLIQWTISMLLIVQKPFFSSFIPLRLLIIFCSLII